VLPSPSLLHGPVTVSHDPRPQVTLCLRPLQVGLNEPQLLLRQLWVGPVVAGEEGEEVCMRFVANLQHNLIALLQRLSPGASQTNSFHLFGSYKHFSFI
jgi:hypothetical protein